MLRLSPRILLSAFNRNPTSVHRFLNVDSSLWSAQGRSSPRAFLPLLRDSSSDTYRLGPAQGDGSHQSRFQLVFFLSSHNSLTCCPCSFTIIVRSAHCFLESHCNLPNTYGIDVCRVLYQNDNETCIDLDDARKAVERTRLHLGPEL
jgi:hypothetical protein